MKQYQVTFSYSVRVVAEDEDGAEDIAWELFGKSDPSQPDDFGCMIDELEVDEEDLVPAEDIESALHRASAKAWVKTDMGNYECVDCCDPVSEEEVFGHRLFGEPRCEGCFDEHKYGA